MRMLCPCTWRQRGRAGAVERTESRGEPFGSAKAGAPAGLLVPEEASGEPRETGEPAERVRASFHRQGFMRYLRAELVEVRPGSCEIHLAWRPEVTQQHGFFHGGVVGTLCDNAGGYAALSVAPPGCSVLTVEYKINFVSPAEGERLVVRARVVRPGRTLVVSSVEASVVKGGKEKLCATALETVMLLPGRPDAPVPRAGWSGRA